MDATMTQNGVLQKTKELCQAILEAPNMGSIRQRIDAFTSNDQSRSRYESLMNKGEALQQKQQLSVAITEAEVDDFERERQAVLADPLARGYIDAQEELHQVQETVQKYVVKTLELMRLPTEQDLSSGCGHGCGCHH